ncbi:MAG: hypothetical protein VX546_05890 [Myxococcota bacterium]|nr:hypothetical protein [Myxococcota bacterium]
MSPDPENRPEPGGRAPRTTRRRVAAVLLVLAGIAGSIHATNLLLLADRYGCDPVNFACREGHDPFVAPDTAGYLQAMLELRERGLFGASMLKRPPGYPALLLAADFTGAPRHVLWLSPVFAGLAAGAIGWLALRASRRLVVAVAAVLVFFWWPNALQLSPVLFTDALHGFAAVSALAATLYWRESESGPAAWLAGALWLFVQSLRVTFFWLPAVLPLLLLKRGASPFYRTGSVALWASGFLVPGFLLVSNAQHHGVFALSEIPARNLACYTVPRIQSELGEGAFKTLRRSCTQRYRHLSPAVRIASQERDAAAFLGAHPAAALASFAKEWVTQLTVPMRPYYHLELASLYRAWPTPGRWFLAIFWCGAAVGLAVRWRTVPREVVFLASLFVGIMVPAATSHLVEGRLRFPLDLVFLPVVFALPAVLWRRRKR